MSEDTDHANTSDSRIDRGPRPHKRGFVGVLGLVLFGLLLAVLLAKSGATNDNSDVSDQSGVETQRAWSSLWNALLTERVYFRGTGRFSSDELQLHGVNPELGYRGFGGSGDVKVVVGDSGNSVCLGVQAGPGARIYAKDVRVGQPAARGRDVGVFFARSDDSTDLTEGCSAIIGATWLTPDMNWGLESVRERWVGCSEPNQDFACSADDRLKDQIVELAGAANAHYMQSGSFSADSVLALAREQITGLPQESEPEVIVADNGRTLCVGAAAESGASYYVKIVEDSRAGPGMLGAVFYYASAMPSFLSLAAKCHEDSVMDWSIFPLVAGW